MNSKFSFFIIAYIAQSALFIFMGIFSIICIYYELTIAKMNWLVMMTRLTALLSFVIVPMEGILLFFIQKYSNFNLEIINDRWKSIYKCAMILIFLLLELLFIIHLVLVDVVIVDRLGLKQGSEIYMLLTRPGSRITLFSMIGNVIYLHLFAYVRSKNK